MSPRLLLWASPAMHCQVCATQVNPSARASPLTFQAHGFPYALPKQLLPAVPPVPVVTSFWVALHVQVSVEVRGDPVEVMGCLIHAIPLGAYGAAAEGQRAALVGPPTVVGCQSGCRAPGGMIPLTVCLRAVKTPAGQRLLAEWE